ncbi:MAG: hypothetical protein KatS3mg105_3703 [Gemmatales bacterium]|nr:MAG: hypothetical protein KatS3mg105_3703 [Gemmatales bacterium]
MSSVADDDRLGDTHSDVVEVPIAMTKEHLNALLVEASKRGLTVGQLLRTLVAECVYHSSVAVTLN